MGDLCKDCSRRVEKVFSRFAVMPVGVLFPGHSLAALPAGDVGEIVALHDNAHAIATPFTTRHPSLCLYPQCEQVPTRTSYVCAQKQPASRTVGSPRWNSACRSIWYDSGKLFPQSKHLYLSFFAFAGLTHTMPVPLSTKRLIRWPSTFGRKPEEPNTLGRTILSRICPNKLRQWFGNEYKLLLLVQALG